MKKNVVNEAWRRLKDAVPACLFVAACLSTAKAHAQLSTNPDKFLGNITTSYSVDYGNEKFYTLWNQITPENESKWASIEGNNDGWNWGGCDNAYNYAKKHNFPFKFHCLIWGAQYPGWLDNLSPERQYEEIVEWMDAVKKRYPDMPMIDVVNEAVPGHQPAPYKEALGGDGKTGYDWIIKAFEMAHERWPDAILIYNDYNTFQWQRTQFIDLVRTLRDAGAPIDAYGCQSHDLTDMNVSSFKSAMEEIQDALKMPMYSTEYDIGTSDDALQLQRYKEQIPYMWEADYCAGITLWGYIYGRTWTTDGNSGIIKDGKDRPAMTWLREYMKTDAAKNAKSPFPGMVKEASVYVKPAALSVTKNEPVPITVRARLKTKTIDHVKLYVKNQLFCTMTEAPYTTEYTPEALGKYDLKAVVVATDGTEYERISSFTAYNPRSPFKGEIALPGTLQAEDFDAGADGISYHDSDTKKEGDASSYRTNGGGVDIVKGNNGNAIGYTATGEWLEYTVNVEKAGIYSYDATVSSGVTNSSFSLSLSTESGLTKLTDVLAVPCVNSNDWNTYRTIHGRLLIPLEAGKQIIRINITGGSCNIDKIVFTHVDVDDKMKLTVTADPAPATINTSTTLKATASSATSTIANVKFYVGNVLLRSVSAEPFEVSYRPTAKGTYDITAIATDADGKQSKIVKYELKVNNKRTAYKGVVSIPGIIQAENFDKGGEGFTFHDADAEDEGDASYRTDDEGVDVVKGNGGSVLGYTAVGEWYEYSINVKEAGKYSCEATVSSGTTGSGFNVGLVKDGKVTTLCRISVPQTGSNSWDTYKVVKSTFNANLEEGEQILRITISGANCNIDKLELKCIVSTDIDEVNAAGQIGGADGQTGNADMYNLAGQKVDENYKGIVIVGGKKILKR
ncbi:MAG: endo-1,4-beta-xylanase [Bacteroidaceae bacterium]|nr:endo-1,4-beta-xylanase [Bacteroidaceae bacterium]